MTDAPSLDQTSRTTVRVQAMRDYHRRRATAAGKEVPPRKQPEPKQLSAKSQTQKFRLGREKILRPWLPVKSKMGKRQAAELLLEKRRVEEKESADRKAGLLTTVENAKQVQVPHVTGDVVGQSKKKYLPSTINDGGVGLAVEEPDDQSFSVYQFTLQVAVLYDSPSIGRLDPFAAMSLLIRPRTQLLLDHYFNVRLQSAWLMMPMRKTLFSVAIHDPAMFHSFMTHYATAYNVRFKTGDKAESIYHANMAAKLINERLADSSQALTDETIATVANMAAHEASNGVVSSMIVHMDGLEKMVRMRGGIEDGGFPLIVQRMIGWADFHVATTLLQKPRFPPLIFPGMEDLVGGSPSCPSECISDALPAVTPSPSLDTLFSGLRTLSQTLRTLQWRSSTTIADIRYSDRVYYLQRNLFDIAHCTEYHKPLDSVCALAALIYCGFRLRDIPFTYARVANAVTRLKDAIGSYEPLNLLGIHERSNVKMLWVLGFGGVASEGKPEHAWFVERFGTCCESLQTNDWLGVRNILDSVLWEPELDEAGLRLWHESVLGMSSSAWIE